jgi:hypothetical protein
MPNRKYTASAFVLFVLLCCSVNVTVVEALAARNTNTPSAQQQQQARRTFLARGVSAGAAAVATVFGATCTNGVSTDGTGCRCGDGIYRGCGGGSFMAANAYERRDVGGESASAETKAMNIQASETNNRLERDGFKLEVR